jgi:hypothetical protein
MRLPRRQFLHLAASAAAMPALSHVASAQTYPSRPITAGGAIDALCRASRRVYRIDSANRSWSTTGRRGLGDRNDRRCTRHAGRTYIDDGRQRGARYRRHAQYEARLRSDKGYCPDRLGRTVSIVLVVNPSLPVQSLADLIKYAKSNPGKLSYGSGGPGSLHHCLPNCS